MIRFAAKSGDRAKAALAALGMAMVAVPAASAFATAEDPTAGLTAEQTEQGRQIFNDWSCGACHVLGDASGTGQIGPSLDGNANLDVAFAKERITNGQGAMPGFGGQITDEEIDLLSKYIVQAKQ